MIDDDNDKVRRNLVVASSIVIIFAWLGVSEAVFIEKLIGNQLVLLNWKISALFIAILTYLSLRYRFADTTKKEYGRLVGEWNAILANNVDKRIHQLLRIFTKKRQDVDIFSPKLSEYVNSQITDKVFGETRDWHLILLQHTSMQPKDAWSGELCMAIDLRDADGYIKRVGGNKVEYSFQGYERYRLIAISSMRLLTYTKGAIDFIAPIAFAITAFMILFLKLFK
jgi:hypothetical protein